MSQSNNAQMSPEGEANLDMNAIRQMVKDLRANSPFHLDSEDFKRQDMTQHVYHGDFNPNNFREEYGAFIDAQFAEIRERVLDSGEAVMKAKEDLPLLVITGLGFNFGFRPRTQIAYAPGIMPSSGEPFAQAEAQREIFNYRLSQLNPLG